MEVYTEDMVGSIHNMQRSYYEQNGEYPTHINMSSVEYSLMKRQLEKTYLLMKFSSDSVKSNNSETILGLIIKIKD